MEWRNAPLSLLGAQGLSTDPTASHPLSPPCAPNSGTDHLLHRTLPAHAVSGRISPPSRQLDDLRCNPLSAPRPRASAKPQQPRLRRPSVRAAGMVPLSVSGAVAGWPAAAARDGVMRMGVPPSTTVSLRCPIRDTLHHVVGSQIARPRPLTAGRLGWELTLSGQGGPRSPAGVPGLQPPRRGGSRAAQSPTWAAGVKTGSEKAPRVVIIPSHCTNGLTLCTQVELGAPRRSRVAQFHTAQLPPLKNTLREPPIRWKQHSATLFACYWIRISCRVSIELSLSSVLGSVRGKTTLGTQDRLGRGLFVNCPGSDAGTTVPSLNQ